MLAVGSFGIFLSYKKIYLKLNPIKLLKIIKNIFDCFSNLKSSNSLYVLFISIIIWLIYLLQVYLVQEAFSLNLNLNQSLIILVISTAVISIPALPGNFGTFESSVVYSLSLFHIIDDFGFAFILHLISFIPFTILGLVYLIKNINLINTKKR